MSAVQALRRGRRAAQRIMIDRGRILRPSADTVIDPVTLTESPGEPTVLHEGPCRVRQATRAEQEVVFGDEVVTRQHWLVNFPHTVTVGAVGDLIEVCSVGDPVVTARTFRIVAVSARTYNLYRQFACEVVV